MLYMQGGGMPALAADDIAALGKGFKSPDGNITKGYDRKQR